MSTKIVFSMFSIGLGLLLIIAGLGYTVNQASNYTTSFMHDNEQGDSSARIKNNDRADASARLRSSSTENVLEEPDAVAAALPCGQRTESPSLFIPALAILSGAVFAVMGAIALAHRLRGIN